MLIWVEIVDFGDRIEAYSYYIWHNYLIVLTKFLIFWQLEQHQLQIEPGIDIMIEIQQSRS